MILSFILYSLLIGACVSLAAMAADRAAAALRAPRRMIWLGAIIVVSTWPVAAVLFGQSTSVPTAPLQQTSTGNFLTTAVENAASFPARTIENVSPALVSIDNALLFTWLIVSTALLLRLLNGALRVRRARKRWRQATIEKMSVSVSGAEGPALIALDKMEIVIPSYVLSFEPSLRKLILQHEREHLVARDPWLLLASRLITAIFPWNATIWWLAHRMRLVLEIDCDARVLRGAHATDTDRYARLLVAIAQRRSTLPLEAPGVALTEGPSQLERRIKAMQLIPIRRRGLVASCAMLFVFASLTFAASIDRPDVVAPSDVATLSTVVAIAKGPVSTQRQWGAFYAQEVDVAPRMAPGNTPPSWPSSLRGISDRGKVVVNFVVDENGRAMMQSLRVTKVSDSAFLESVRAVLPNYKFIPGELNSAPVRVWITLPFDFIRQSASQQSDTVTRAQSQASQAPRLNKNFANSGAYAQSEVQVPARLAPGNPPPNYPEALRSARRSGKVLVAFVITPNGAADMSTFMVLETTSSEFADAVKAVIPRYKFIPAQLNGSAVPMWVSLPFDFVMSRGR